MELLETKQIKVNFGKQQELVENSPATLNSVCLAHSHSACLFTMSKIRPSTHDVTLVSYSL